MNTLLVRRLLVTCVFPLALLTAPAAPAQSSLAPLDQGPTSNHAVGQITAIDLKTGRLAMSITVRTAKVIKVFQTFDKTRINRGDQKTTLADVHVGESASLKLGVIGGKEVIESISVTPKTGGPNAGRLPFKKVL